MHFPRSLTFFTRASILGLSVGFCGVWLFHKQRRARQFKLTALRLRVTVVARVSLQLFTGASTCLVAFFTFNIDRYQNHLVVNPPRSCDIGYTLGTLEIRI